MAEILARSLIGGLFVTAFALVSAMVSPKRFAGVFSAAPSVALGSLTMTLATKGVHAVEAAAIGMAVSAVAMLAYCVVALPALGRFGALRGAGLAVLAWALVAGVGAWVIL